MADLKTNRFENTRMGLKILNVTNRFGIFFMILILVIIGLIVAPVIFFTPKNLLDILEVGAMTGIVTFGVAMITLSGNMCDLSVPGMMALGSILAAALLPYGLPVSIIGAMAGGLLVGAVNGVMVGRLKANPILWTLAMQFLLGGILRWITSGAIIYPDALLADQPALVESFYQVYRFRLFGVISMGVIVMVVVLILFQLILSKTRYGRELKITGSNYKAAQASGINTQRVVMGAFMFSGVCSGIGGLFLSSLVKVGDYTQGAGYDFTTITAIVLGGVTLMGGRGSIIGVFGGVFTLGLLSNVMVFVGLSTFEQLFVKGLVFILIVWFNSYSLRKLGKDYV